MLDSAGLFAQAMPARDLTTLAAGAAEVKDHL